MTRDVLEYKRINGLIHNIISDMKRLTFLKINEFEEYEPDVFCTVQYNEVKAQTHVIQTRCNTLARHVKKIHKMLEVCSETETNQQWDGYRIAIGNYLAEALILSVGRYVVTTASYFIIFRLLIILSLFVR